MNKPNGNGSGALYKVAYAELVQSALKDLLGRAKEKGILGEVLAAVKEIQNLKHGKGQVRTAFVRPLAVAYTVYEEERIVLVTRPLLPLPEIGL